jgi:predicted nucleic acid-binding protein
LRLALDTNTYTDLRRQGTPVPVHDLWIAALAEQTSSSTLATGISTAYR